MPIIFAKVASAPAIPVREPATMEMSAIMHPRNNPRIP